MSAPSCAAPACTDCAHLQGKSTCTRPVPRFWNPATNQYRSRLSIGTQFERSNKKFFGRSREKCGPDGVFFEGKGPPIGGRSGNVIVDELAFAAVHDTPYQTRADSDGDDGA